MLVCWNNKQSRRHQIRSSLLNVTQTRQTSASLSRVSMLHHMLKGPTTCQLLNRLPRARRPVPVCLRAFSRRQALSKPQLLPHKARSHGEDAVMFMLWLPANVVCNRSTPTSITLRPQKTSGSASSASTSRSLDDLPPHSFANMRSRIVKNVVVLRKNVGYLKKRSLRAGKARSKRRMLQRLRMRTTRQEITRITAMSRWIRWATSISMMVMMTIPYRCLRLCHPESNSAQCPDLSTAQRTTRASKEYQQEEAGCAEANQLVQRASLLFP